MWFKLVAAIVLSNSFVTASKDCDGSVINEGGLIPSSQKNKAGFGEFPWTVALYKKDSPNPHCAGAIIDDSTIITTAFCLTKITNPSDLIIRAGLWDLNRTSVEDYQMQQRVASDLKPHPKNTSPDPIDNDIAIVRVSQPFKFNQYIHEVCLDTGNLKVSPDGCFATGWGAETYATQNELSQYLKKIRMDQVDHKTCEKQLGIAFNDQKFTLPESFFCAGGNEFDLCIGDAGAPVICPIVGVPNKFVLTGLSSYGVKCFTETPGVYTKINIRMIPRPKKTDTMDDVLEMQNKYLKQKTEENFQPAAQAIRPEGSSSEEPTSKQSVFAKRRNLKQSEGDKKLKTVDVVGEVVERGSSGCSSEEFDDEAGPSAADKGFPSTSPIDICSPKKTKGKKSLFSQMVKSQKKVPQEAADTDSNNDEEMKESDETSSSSQEETIKEFSKMTEEEILAQRSKLIGSMDPKMVEFLRSRKQPKESIARSSPSKLKVPPKSISADEIPALDFLHNPNAMNWLHFDVIEPEKLEWTRNIGKSIPNLQPGETYEARFDLKGFLLPYIEENKEEIAPGKEKDDRELYMHEKDPHRPGYALQELFRLSRANVLQQRVTALNAISGIINIYNQGYYDGILDLPITRIYFLLRLALDENTPATLEASSRALANLFYNDADETLLDLLYETSYGFVQPIMDNSRASIAGIGVEDTEIDLESSLKNLTLDEGRKLFESNVDDVYNEKDIDKQYLSDLHLAEVNLAESFMRTNILERITYILTVTQPSTVTINSCLKILIRLSRVSQEFATKILNKKNLMEHMIGELLPTSGSPKVYHLVLKLFRVISSYDRVLCQELKKLGAVETAKKLVLMTHNLNVGMLKVHIESFRFLRLYFHLFIDENLFKEMVSPIRFLMEWHYQNLNFQLESHFIVRQHACALMYLFKCGDLVHTFSYFSETFKSCISKWFQMAYRDGLNEFSQKLLLSAVLDIGKPIVERATGFFFDFVDNHLLKFLQSQHYYRITKNLTTTSPLIRDGHDRCNIHKPLINLGSIIRRYEDSPPTLIFTPDYSIFFIDALLNFTDAYNNSSNVKNNDYYHKICGAFFNEEVEKYFEKFSTQYSKKLSTNWFLKAEINFIYNLLNSKLVQFNSCLLAAVFNLITCLTKENLARIISLFKCFVFSSRYYYGHDNTQEEFERWKYIYNGIVVSRVGDLSKIKMKIAVAENWNQLILTESWPYSLLMILLYRAEVESSEKIIVHTELTEEDIIVTTLKFTLMLEKNNIQLISTNQKLMYLMLIYFGENRNFLDPPVKQLILKKLKTMRHFHFPKRFNMKLNKEKSFESIFKMFLDAFQSNSFNDEVFSIFVMVPLPQKYDIKWRKLVWMEHSTDLKFVTCKEEDLFDDINEYLFPIETDAELLKAYEQVLNSNLLKEDSVLRKIAEHHVKHALKETSISTS
ncbi:CLUMA_CG011207, isoform A [Clunio marinus]|uniref:CLUMA_CG011207, isoform A n=1 Tax=Clunio marinus TaxID=568069 RepID=A0A1J1IC21_9DIPT|nr:CLUMA_CG011207, isoform A [Clunio marinus]